MKTWTEYGGKHSSSSSAHCPWSFSICFARQDKFLFLFSVVQVLPPFFYKVSTVGSQSRAKASLCNCGGWIENSEQSEFSLEMNRVSHQLQSCTSHWNKMGCSEVWMFNMFSINSRDGLTTFWCVFTCTGEPQWETCWLFSNPHRGQLGDTRLSRYSYVLQFCKVCVDGLNEMIPGSKAHQTFLAFLLKVFVWRSQIS